MGSGLTGIKRDLCFFAGKIHTSADKRLFVQHFFDAAGAGLTGHAFNAEAGFLFHNHIFTGFQVAE